MLVIPFNAIAAAGDCELSSTFQPVMSTATALVLVTSNQSAATGLLLLDHGATSEILNFPTLPGYIPIKSSYGVFAFEMARYARTCIHFADFRRRRNACCRQKADITLFCRHASQIHMG